MRVLGASISDLRRVPHIATRFSWMGNGVGRSAQSGPFARSGQPSDHPAKRRWTSVSICGVSTSDLGSGSALTDEVGREQFESVHGVLESESVIGTGVSEICTLPKVFVELDNFLRMPLGRNIGRLFTN